MESYHEAKIKPESLKFFNLFSENEMKAKKRFKIALESRVTACTKSQKNLLREVLKMHNGGGVFHDIPPAEYSTPIVDDKKQKSLFETSKNIGSRGLALKMHPPQDRKEY